MQQREAANTRDGTQWKKTEKKVQKGFWLFDSSWNLYGSVICFLVCSDCTCVRLILFLFVICHSQGII